MLAQRELRQILAEGHEAGILHPAQQILAHGILAVARKPLTQFLAPPGQIVPVRAGTDKQARSAWPSGTTRPRCPWPTPPGGRSATCGSST